jgi:hypothetical protein
LDKSVLSTFVWPLLLGPLAGAIAATTTTDALVAERCWQPWPGIDVFVRLVECVL